MPNLQMAFLIVEKPLSAQLHTKDKKTKQLCQASAEDIEAQIQLKTVSQVGEGVLPECTMLVYAVDLAIHFP